MSEGFPAPSNSDGVVSSKRFACTYPPAASGVEWSRVECDREGILKVVPVRKNEISTLLPESRGTSSRMVPAHDRQYMGACTTFYFSIWNDAPHSRR